MQSQNSAVQERAAHGRTGPRADTILVGVDTDGCHHLLKTERATDTILVVQRGDVLWREPNVSADAWMDHIAANRGWADRRLGAFVDCYEAQLETLREGSA